MANCAGIVLFNNEKTVLVETEKAYYSFPKGKNGILAPKYFTEIRYTK